MFRAYQRWPASGSTTSVASLSGGGNGCDQCAFASLHRRGRRGARYLQSREPAPQMTAAACLFADAAAGSSHTVAFFASAGWRRRRYGRQCPAVDLVRAEPITVRETGDAAGYAEAPGLALVTFHDAAAGLAAGLAPPRFTEQNLFPRATRWRSESRQFIRQKRTPTTQG
jgi:hypothetical protein